MSLDVMYTTFKSVVCLEDYAAKQLFINEDGAGALRRRSVRSASVRGRLELQPVLLRRRADRRAHRGGGSYGGVLSGQMLCGEFADWVMYVPASVHLLHRRKLEPLQQADHHLEASNWR